MPSALALPAKGLFVPADDRGGDAIIAGRFFGNDDRGKRAFVVADEISFPVWNVEKGEVLELGLFRFGIVNDGTLGKGTLLRTGLLSQDVTQKKRAT